jgi:hypothetical protein
MKLTALDPRWLVVDGHRLGIVFRCPHCEGCYLSCFFTPMPRIAGDDYHDCQYALFATVLPESDVHEVVPCKRNYAWVCSPPVEQASFETLSVTPSLDASASGHWHGHITNGEIR